jgi:hypothetical protein
MSTRTVTSYKSHVSNALKEGINKRLDRGAPKTQHAVTAALKAWASFIEDQELLESLKTRKLPPPHRRKDEPPLDREEWKKLKALVDTSKEIDSPVREVLQLILIRGFRSGDVLRMERTEIEDALDRTGILTYIAKGKKSTTLDIRRIKEPLGKIAKFGKDKNWTKISDLISKSKKEDYSAAWQILDRSIKRMFKAAGLDSELAHLHLLRATHADHYYKLVKDPVTLMKYMDWSDINTAIGYINRFKRGELEEIAEILDDDV